MPTFQIRGYISVADDRFFHANDGSRYMRQNGRWRVLTAEEEQIADEGAAEQAVSAFGIAGASTLGILKQGAGFLMQGAFAQQAEAQRRIGNFELGDNINREGEKIRREMVESGGQITRIAEQALETRRKIAPGATAVGETTQTVLELALTGDVPLIAAGRGLGSAAAKRAAARAALPPPRQGGPRLDLKVSGEEINLRPDELSRQQIGDVGEIAQMTGKADSAGAARVGDPAEASAFLQTMGKIPGMKQGMESLQKFVGKARPLTPDQKAIIARGARHAPGKQAAITRAQELGFQFLPGQENGNGVISEIISSQPFLADAFDGITGGNADRLTELVMNSLGLEGQLMGRNILDQSDTILNHQFAQIADKIGTINLPLQVADDIAKDALPRASANALLNKFQGGATNAKISGKAAMELRSRLQKQRAALARDNQELAAEQVEESIDAIDNLIRKNLDPQWQAEWEATQQRFRVRMAIENTIDRDGNISLRKLNTGLERSFKAEYKGQLFAPQATSGPQKFRTGIPNEIADLMDFSRMANAFDSNLGNSGTATRMAIGELFKGPSGWKTLMQQRIGAKFITDYLVDPIPEAP